MSRSKERKGTFSTVSGVEIERCYSEKNRASANDTSLPGEFPFTRGVYDTMYRGRLWTMRQYAGFGTASETNKRYKYLLSQGITGLSVAFDLPTQMGRDSDHPLSKGEVGRVGVAISSVEDIDTLFADIPLRDVSVSMTINATAAILLSLLLVIAEERKIPWSALKGTIQNDVLKEYVARGTYIYPPEAALRIVTDIFGFCSKEVPNWNTISVSGYHIREAGSTAIQELAFTLADGIAYVQAAIDAGLSVDEFAPRVAFFFNCHNEFLEEIAKFRAARRMWAKIMKERFGAKKPESMMLRFHTQTAGSSLTAQQPKNNLVRTTIQALAAVLGGTQSLHTNSFDEAHGLPTEESALLALRTQQIIAHESGVPDTVDPLGGSYLIENWTDKLESEANKIIEKIDTFGGMLRAIEEGYPQGEIERAAYTYQREIESGERIIVGVNKFGGEDTASDEIHAIDPKGEAEQCKRLAKLRSGRDKKVWEEKIKELRTSLSDGSNLMPRIIGCIRARATLGEISDVMREVFGEHRERISR